MLRTLCSLSLFDISNNTLLNVSGRNHDRDRISKWAQVFVLSASIAWLSGCASISSLNDPSWGSRNDTMRLELKLSQQLKITKNTHQYIEYDSATRRFGSVLEAYRGEKSPPLYIQTKAIGDSTGLSAPLIGSELPADITEMVRSTINSIGANVVYVPFHPDYVIAQSQQGVNMSITVPEIVITGAITQFDRSVASTGKTLDLGLLFGSGSGQTNSALSKKSTATISRLGLDFNVIDFKTQTMIPRVQAVNTMNVLNETSEGSVNFAIYGNGMGLARNARHVQGRHQAIRDLVELCMIQIIGRYTSVPYWRAFPDMEADFVVLERLRKSYLNQSEAQKVAWLQNTLADYGEQVKEDGMLGDETLKALMRVLRRLEPMEQLPDDFLSPDIFITLYLNIPLEKNEKAEQCD